MIIKPSPPDLQDIYLGSLAAIGIDMALHDIRFVEDDWESPTLGAWGLGWEVWCDGMEVCQYTYFQQVGGHDCRPVSGELTYGLERLAMYVLGYDDGNLHAVQRPRRADPAHLRRRLPRGRGASTPAGTSTSPTPPCCSRHFEDAEAECARILAEPDDRPEDRPAHRHGAARLRPDASRPRHLFNLLDARGVISVTERQAYIGRVRALAKACADAYVAAEPA